MNKKLAAMLLAATMLLTACGGSGSGSKESSGSESKAPSSEASEASKSGDAGDKILIGGLGPLTGPVATYGVSATNGIKLAFEEINAKGGILGKQVEFLLEDEKGDPTEAVNAYNKLMDEGIVALIGDITSAPSLVVAQETQSSGIPMITPTGTQLNITEGHPNVFRACYTDPFQGEVLATFAVKNLNAKTAAVLTNTGSEYSDGVVKKFVETAGKLGLEVVASESYGDADNDIRTQLTSIAAKQPDVLLIADYYEKDALFVQQAHEVGLKAKILGSDGWDGTLSQLGDNAKAADGIYFANHYAVDSTDPTVKSFVDNYKAKYNENPTAFSALGYDAAYMLKDAIEKAGTTDYAKVVEALKGLKFTGVTGSMTFDANNNPIKEVSIMTVENGQYKFFTKVSVDAK